MSSIESIETSGMFGGLSAAGQALVDACQEVRAKSVESVSQSWLIMIVRDVEYPIALHIKSMKTFSLGEFENHIICRLNKPTNWWDFDDGADYLCSLPDEYSGFAPSQIAVELDAILKHENSPWTRLDKIVKELGFEPSYDLMVALSTALSKQGFEIEYLYEDEDGEEPDGDVELVRDTALVRAAIQKIVTAQG